jgi:SAM-dependent methyltransferase
MYLRHLAVYKFAQSMANERRVLDLGSGMGYGATLLAASAGEVVALDSAPEAVRATKLEPAALASLVGNGTRLPFRDDIFDLVVSFQVIEHIRDESHYLAEVRRVLTPGGLFLLSTPNRKLRLLPFQPPFNPYHVREYDRRSFRKVLEKHFDDVKVWGVQGNAEVMCIEHERLKRNPLRVYIELIGGKLPPAALQVLWNLMRILRPKSPSRLKGSANSGTHSLVSEDTYSINDFWIEANNIDRSLDLIGICHKPAQPTLIPKSFSPDC